MEQIFVEKIIGIVILSFTIGFITGWFWCEFHS